VQFSKKRNFETTNKKYGTSTAHNEHIGEIAAVSPQKRQCEFGSYYPARTFVKPLPRQYATTLGASERQWGGEWLRNQTVTSERPDILFN